MKFQFILGVWTNNNEYEVYDEVYHLPDETLPKFIDNALLNVFEKRHSEVYPVAYEILGTIPLKSLVITLPDGRKHTVSDLQMDVAERLSRQIKKTFKLENEVILRTNFVDLGLPSGTLWADENISGYHSFGDALTVYGTALPSKEQMQELTDQCEWTLDNQKRGCRITGPNGNSIYLPASGYMTRKIRKPVATNGCLYWSKTLCGKNKAVALSFLHFNEKLEICSDNHTNVKYECCIRLVSRRY